MCSYCRVPTHATNSRSREVHVSEYLVVRLEPLIGLTVLNAKLCGQVFRNEPGSSEDCCQRTAENDRGKSGSI